MACTQRVWNKTKWLITEILTLEQTRSQLQSGLHSWGLSTVKRGLTLVENPAGPQAGDGFSTSPVTVKCFQEELLPAPVSWFWKNRKSKDPKTWVWEFPVFARLSTVVQWNLSFLTSPWGAAWLWNAWKSHCLHLHWLPGIPCHMLILSSFSVVKNVLFIFGRKEFVAKTFQLAWK